MDIQTATTLIGSLGFPIVMCLMLFWYMKEQLQAINELKIAITTLAERINHEA